MEREVKKITTKSGIEIDLKTYLTGREMNEWRALFLKQISMSMEGKIDSSNMPGEIVELLEKKAIELVVNSINGEKENILDKVLDLPLVDYREITDEAMKVMEGVTEFFAKKK